MHSTQDMHENALSSLPEQPAGDAETWRGLRRARSQGGGAGGAEEEGPGVHCPMHSCSTNDVVGLSPTKRLPVAHTHTSALKTKQMEEGKGSSTPAESKRHSWAAHKQGRTVVEDSRSEDISFNRALSLDSGVMRHQDTLGSTAQKDQAISHISIMDSQEQGKEDSVNDIRQSNLVYRNGNVTSQSEIDVMTLSHDPHQEYDKAKYITAPELAESSRHSSQSSSCCNFLLCAPCSKCCSRSRHSDSIHHCQSLSYFWANLFKHGNCSCKKKEPDTDSDDELYMEDDPLRKRCLRAFLNFVYVLLALIAVVVTYSMIQDLITAMNNPVRSIHYLKVRDYDAPGISMYPGGAKFVACGHYYNNVVTSKVRTSDLDLENRNCTFTRLKYDDPHYIGVKRDVLVIRGPTSFEQREAIFLHFELEDETRDFFTVSYFVFPGWDKFNASSIPEQIDELTRYHTYVPTFALSSGLRMWIKLIMSETYLRSDTKHTEFKVEKEEFKHTEFTVEYSVVKFWDRRPTTEKKKHLFFIFFEWKNNIIEQSYLVYTTTPWSIGAGLCGVFLTLHRGYQLAQIGYKRARKDKERRSIRKRTIRELKKAKSVEKSRDGSGSSVVTNRKLRQQLTG